jgi:nucleoside 2-deoxyribosyltransferase
MIYLAGPVFTLAERRFNEELAGELERLCPSLQVFLPQRYDKAILWHQRSCRNRTKRLSRPVPFFLAAGLVSW